MLTPLNVLVLLKLVAKKDQAWTQAQIASELHISVSVVNKALKAAESLRLYTPRRKRVNGLQLDEVLAHGARYFLTATQGGEVRGLLTAWSAPPLSEQVLSADPLPPVWPDPTGAVRGLRVEPLHPNVPLAAKEDAALYELLAILDVLRMGVGARESNLAKRALHERLIS